MRPLALAALLALSCAPRARVASELGDVPIPPHTARICVVRPDEAGAEKTMTVRDNGRLVGATRGRTYTCWLATPGAHQIGSDADATGPLLLDVKAHGRYFLHLEIGELGAHLLQVNERDGETLVDQCDARVLVSVPGHEDVADALPIARAR